jgi:hypothetical protein
VTPITELYSSKSFNRIRRIFHKGVGVMILIRFAISLFALALLGMAFSLSAAHSQQPAPVVMLR